MMIIRTNLNPRYVILARETLKEKGREIAKARASKDLDCVVDLITDAKSIKQSMRYNINNAKKYQTNNDGTGFQWM